jgi:hypothetical protein
MFFLPRAYVNRASHPFYKAGKHKSFLMGLSIEGLYHLHNRKSSSRRLRYVNVRMIRVSKPFLDPRKTKICLCLVVKVFLTGYVNRGGDALAGQTDREPFRGYGQNMGHPLVEQEDNFRRYRVSFLWGVNCFLLGF